LWDIDVFLFFFLLFLIFRQHLSDLLCSSIYRLRLLFNPFLLLWLTQLLLFHGGLTRTILFTGLLFLSRGKSLLFKLYLLTHLLLAFLDQGLTLEIFRLNGCNSRILFLFLCLLSLFELREDFIMLINVPLVGLVVVVTTL